MSYAFNKRKGKRAAKQRAEINRQIAEKFGEETVHLHSKARLRKVYPDPQQ